MALLAMGFAMLSTDGMAQATRQAYNDIINIHLTPGAPRRRAHSSRQQAWPMGADALRRAASIKAPTRNHPCRRFYDVMMR